MSETAQQLPAEEPLDDLSLLEPLEAGTPDDAATLDGRVVQVYQRACDAFSRNPDWVTFFRVILGEKGLIRRAFGQGLELATFQRTAEYAEIQKMLAKLRERSKYPENEDEPTRVITVRLPRSLHEALKAEAHERKTNMNQLCISKLVQLIDREFVPED